MANAIEDLRTKTDDQGRCRFEKLAASPAAAKISEWSEEIFVEDPPIRRGSGKLAVALTASAYRISVRSLPRSIEIEAVVTDPDGRPLRGEKVVFTLTVPGVPAITGEEVTAAGGVAVFRTTIPAGATRGSGLATAFVDTAEHGEASTRLSITFVR